MSAAPPLKVLLVAALFPPYHTGAGRRWLGYARDLAARGVQLSVLTATPTPGRARAARQPVTWAHLPLGATVPSPDVGLPLRRVRLPDAGRRGRMAVLAAAAAREIARTRPDAVLLLEHSFEFLPLILACRALRVPIAVAYTLVLAHARSRLRRALERGLWPLPFTWVDGVVANSARMAESLRHVGVTRPIEVIPNGVPRAVFHPSPSPEARAAGREALGLPAGRRTVLFVGAISPRKGPELVLAAFARAAPALPDVDLVLAGPWIDAPGAAEGAFAAEVRGRVDALGRRVTVLGQTDRIADLLRVSDALVLASTREGLPNVMLEAMASGCPVLTTRFEGDASADGPPPGTLFVTRREVEPLAAGLTSLLTDRDATAAQVALASAWVARAHDRDATLDAYAAFFRSLAQRSSPPGLRGT